MATSFNLTLSLPTQELTQLARLQSLHFITVHVHTIETTALKMIGHTAGMLSSLTCYIVLVCVHDRFQYAESTNNKVALDVWALCLELWKHEDELFLLAGLHNCLLINWSIYRFLSFGTSILICLFCSAFLFADEVMFKGKHHNITPGYLGEILVCHYLRVDETSFLSGPNQAILQSKTKRTWLLSNENMLSAAKLDARKHTSVTQES